MIDQKAKKGHLEVVCGSMFSGKSEELIRRLRRAEIAQQKVLVFKHSLDTRKTIDYIVSHNGNKLKAFALSSATEILELVDDDVSVIGIDEVQFFSNEIVNTIHTLVNRGKRVIAAGLDLDFRGVPFGSIPLLMAIADSATKLKAVCIKCGDNAHFTQRLINNQPAKYNDPVILVGAEEFYQARCRNCFAIDRSPIYNYERI